MIRSFFVSCCHAVDSLESLVKERRRCTYAEPVIYIVYADAYNLSGKRTEQMILQQRRISYGMPPVSQDLAKTCETAAAIICVLSGKSICISAFVFFCVCFTARHYLLFYKREGENHDNHRCIGKDR